MSLRESVKAEKEKYERLIQENQAYMRHYVKEEDWYSIIKTARDIELLQAGIEALKWVLATIED
jgi:hypothetical protein